MRKLFLLALLALACVFAVSAETTELPSFDFDRDFADQDVISEVFMDEDDDAADVDDEEEQEEDSDDDSEDESDLEEEEAPSKVDVHIYLPVPGGQADEEKAFPATSFPKWPGLGKAPAGGAAAPATTGDYITDHINIFQEKVAAIVRRLRKEKAGLDKKDKKMDAHLAAIKKRIAKAKATISEIEKEDNDAKARALAAAREKALRDKMRSHPVLSKLYTARKFVIELKRMVRALSTMNPDSIQYAAQLKKVQESMREVQKEGMGLEDLDEMINVGAGIADIEIEKVRDDEIAGLNGVLCAMMKHIQGEINKIEAKIRADHEGELAAAGQSRDARLAAAKKALAAAEADLANYKSKMQREHMQIKRKLRRINAELKQLGAIDGHVTKYRRSRVQSAIKSTSKVGF